MAKEKYFLGIDGGGTRTIGVVSDSKGRIVAYGTGDSINYHALGMSEAKNNYKRLLIVLKEKLHINQFDTIYIGSSALERKATKLEINVLAGQQNERTSVYMHSDVFVGLMGLTLGKPGVLVISGTGSIAAAIDNQGKFHVAGGWGYIIGDEGSAYDISLMAVKAAIKGSEGIGPPTSLTQYVMEYFKVSQLKDLIYAFYEVGIPRHETAGFAKFVDACAETGDITAMDILKRAASELASLGIRLLKDLKQPDPIVGIYGGVLRNSKLVRNYFTKNINRDFPKARIMLPEFPPEIGAIYLCFVANNLPFDENIVANIRSTYMDRSGGEKK